jgi:CheY-like chemotaxis protein
VSGRKTVLLVDDDPGTLYVLANGLSTVLAMFEVVTAADGREAVAVLEERQIDALVTDLAMPVMDGFALIAYVTNRRSSLPVVVLSGMAPHSMDHRLAGYGGLRVLRKPASYQDVATCVLEELERVDMGQVEGIPLASVLQLLEAERSSCSVVVTSGKRRGRLQFESGRLINAFSDDFGAEGEAAAYDILSWNDTAIEFEQLPNNLRKLVHTPMQLMLIELAVVQDGIRHRTEEPTADDPMPTETGDAAPEAEAGSDDGPASGTRPEAEHHGLEIEPEPEAEEAAADATIDGALRGADADVDVLADDGPLDGFDAVVPTPGVDDDAAQLPTHVRIVSVAEPTLSHLDIHAQEVIAAAGVAEATTHAMTGNGEAMRTDDDHPPTDPAAAPAAVPAAVPEAAVPPPIATTAPHGGSDDHVAAMLAAVERLAQRARAADEALAAVAAEVDAFQVAQRRFDEANARRESRRRELEAFREDVARLAREILGRVDGVFDAMAEPDAEPAAAERTPG